MKSYVCVYINTVQTSPGAHPASSIIGILGVKRPRRGINHPPLSSAKVKERVELYLYSLFRSSWPVAGQTLPFLYINTDLANSKFLDIINAKLAVRQESSNSPLTNV
jgi:hypothetical protein